MFAVEINDTLKLMSNKLESLEELGIFQTERPSLDRLNESLKQASLECKRLERDLEDIGKSFCDRFSEDITKFSEMQDALQGIVASVERTDGLEMFHLLHQCPELRNDE